MMGLVEKRNEYGRHWILRDAKTALVDTTGREGDKITYQPIKRIRVHPANPSKIYIQYEYKNFGGTYTATMVTNDDGVTWSEINPPSFSGDGGRGHSLGFNYRQPQRTYIAVDPQNVVFPDEPFRAYYTDDDGVTLTQIEFSPEKCAPLWELGVGIWSEDRGIDFVWDGGLKLYFHIDSVASDGQRITLYREQKWLDRVRSTLLPNYDSSTQRLAYGYQFSLGPHGYIDGFAFHPERPQTFALTFILDTLVDGKWIPIILVAATTDFGETWHEVLRFRTGDAGKGITISTLVIDPLSNSVYCSYQHSVRDSSTGTMEYLNSYTIKWTPDVASTVETPVAGRAVRDIVAYPNPAPKNGMITFQLPSTFTAMHNEIPDVSFVSINGRSHLVSVIQDDAFHRGTTKGDMRFLNVWVNDLAPGFYTAVVSVGSNRWACHVIVSP